MMKRLLFLLSAVALWGCTNLPVQEQIDRRVTLDQNWRPGWEVGQAQWFHHASQGTKILPYDWFMALEQPGIILPQKPFSQSGYLERFGFIPSTRFDQQNPDGLPIGFAIEENFQEPFAKQPYNPSDRDAPMVYAKPPYAVVGLTCAACHTGQINYQGTAIRVEGGSAMVNLRAFQGALATALYLTDRDPFRFDRFSKKVLQERAKDKQAVKALKNELHMLIERGLEEKAYQDKHKINPVASGFSRTDALALIGNRVFGQFGRANLDVANAPVNFPHLWDTPWFEWVQYNASIRLPMIRNIGEALGVGAIVNLDRNKGKKYASTINVKNLHLMEDQLGGDEPFSGLRSPKWPEDILGKLDSEKIRRGRELYNRLCVDCHLPPVETLQAEYTNPESEFWTKPNQYQKRFLVLKKFDLLEIGTDPGQALNLYRRVAFFESKGHTATAAEALYSVAGLIRNRAYRHPTKLSDEMQAQWNRHRDRDTGPPIAANLAYKARPLNGIWATPPYLHNSSVPNLYELLLPAAQRSKEFYLGSKSYDPVRVGYQHGKLQGGFLFDTTGMGNDNTGHEFRDLTEEEGRENWRAKGVVGPLLTDEQRWDLIEYLKSL